jgi:ribosomal protein L11 methyltransferase
VAGLLERTFSQLPAIFRDEDTRATLVTVYPKRLPLPPLRLRDALRGGLARLREFEIDPGKTRITIKPLPRRNWAESWKHHFKPIEIGNRLLIKPGWSRRRPRPGQCVVILDPGLSFGTGHHPTTLFCLEQIARFRRADAKQSFLDIGTGSAILAIAAAKLGYDPVLAFDCDPEAVRAAHGNVKQNDVQDRVQLRRGDIHKWPLKARRKYDLVCANLTADLLLANAEKICDLVKPLGRLVLAGILDREFLVVTEKLRQIGLTMERTRLHKSWKSGQFAHGDSCAKRREGLQ